MQRPFFSVLITTYNRASLIGRCVDSCLDQTFTDFEVVVVDDGSTDDTVATLRRWSDPRLRVVAHELNRGISTSRHTAVRSARGEWLVVVDSDWELFPHTLERLREVVLQLPPGVRIVRSRLIWDDGHLTPEVIPEGVVDYAGRIAWLEALTAGSGESDAGHCLHRSVFDATPYITDRRGAMEMLWGLDVSTRELSYFVPDVLGKQYAGAPNSYLRGVDRRELIPRLLREADDMLWMAETTLAEHAVALARHGPRQLHGLVKLAAVQSFLLGDRRAGIRHTRRSLRRDPRDVMAWGTLVLGLLGPRALAFGTLAYRRYVARGISPDRRSAGGR